MAGIYRSLYYADVTVGSGGRLTIPQEIREDLGLEDGNTLTLRVEESPSPKKLYSLSDGGVYTIGRDGADIPLDDGKVSRKHEPFLQAMRGERLVDDCHLGALGFVILAHLDLPFRPASVDFQRQRRTEGASCHQAELAGLARLEVHHDRVAVRLGVAFRDDAGHDFVSQHSGKRGERFQDWTRLKRQVPDVRAADPAREDFELYPRRARQRRHPDLTQPQAARDAKDGAVPHATNRASKHVSRNREIEADGSHRNRVLDRVGHHRSERSRTKIPLRAPSVKEAST